MSHQTYGPQTQFMESQSSAGGQSTGQRSSSNSQSFSGSSSQGDNSMARSGGRGVGGTTFQEVRDGSVNWDQVVDSVFMEEFKVAQQRTSQLKSR